MNTPEGIAQELSKALKARFNVLLSGPHGVGKTAIVNAAAAELNLEVKYFSTPTLDPFADLVGIPVPLVEGESRRLLFLRPDFIHKAEVLFFDELNRAQPRVLNAVLEIVLFHTINGESLPRLRNVVAAINPPSGAYQCQELDPALLDRFHIHLEMAFGPSLEWFVGKFGDLLGRALVEWHKAELDDHERGLVSNRRLEFLGLAIQAGMDPSIALPVGSSLPVHLLMARLNPREGALSIEDFVNAPEKYLALLQGDMNVAVRFVQLLPMMNPLQKCKVRELLLALPGEMLAQLQAVHPFVFKKTCEAVARLGPAGEGPAYSELLQERLAQLAR